MVAGLAGVFGVGAVLASDPVAYGVPFWPFADSVDLAEQQLMTFVADAARNGLPVGGSDVEVTARSESRGNTFLTLRLRVDGETRCREAILGAPGFSSRRVNC
ncbi:hypothetical protein Lesp02_78420 [Lentzea sp. NBRC 105346]|nr:hypothetical protein Lesp02_78420 [Lentzea sp. NBRC 105346]